MSKKFYIMKKFFILMSMAAAFLLSGCSKDAGVPAGSTKGMTLTANVDQSETRASFSGWKFAFTQGDNLLVNNSENVKGNYFEYFHFVCNSKGIFESTDAESTDDEATWFACYPNAVSGSTGDVQLNLDKQDGTEENLYKYICYYGSQGNVPAETTNLTMTLHTQVAIIKITNWLGAITLYAKDAESKYIYRMVSPREGGDFEVGSSTTNEKYLLQKTSNGTYYIAVPAQTAFDLYNGDNKIKSISATQLDAGKYYTLTLGTEPAPSTTLYSYTMSDQDNKAGEYDESYGGKMKIGASDKYNSSYGVKLDGVNTATSGSKYVQVTVSKALAEGDVITLQEACGSTPSGSNYGCAIGLTKVSADAITTLYIPSAAGKNSLTNVTYTVTSADGLAGQTSFFIFCNYDAGASKSYSTYLNAVTITCTTAR